MATEGLNTLCDYLWEVVPTILFYDEENRHLNFFFTVKCQLNIYCQITPQAQQGIRKRLQEAASIAWC